MCAIRPVRLPRPRNLSFTSVNLPRIAIRSHGDLDWFFEDLDRKIDLVIDQLLDRFRIQCGKRVRNYPFLMGEGVWLDSEKLGPMTRLARCLSNGTPTLGFIGQQSASRRSSACKARARRKTLVLRSLCHMRALG